MSLSENVGRLATTLAGMLHTRLELITVELEEELLRFASYFVYSLITLFCAGMAVALTVFLIIALYWDTHKIAVVLILIGLFSGVSIGLAYWLRQQFLTKPRLLEHSISEFKKDTGFMSSRSKSDPGEHE